MKLHSNFVLCISALCFGACNATRQVAVADIAQVSRGQRIYALSCRQCHSGGDGGIGPTLKTSPLPRFQRLFQKQHGIGMIGVFEEKKLTDADLKAIAAYVASWKGQQ